MDKLKKEGKGIDEAVKAASRALMVYRIKQLWYLIEDLAEKLAMFIFYLSGLIIISGIAIMVVPVLIRMLQNFLSR